MKTPYPAEASEIQLALDTLRLTGPDDVRALLFHFGRVKGNVVEIGCNRGMTTHELAKAMPERTIYAVDYLVAESGPQSGEKPSPEWFCDVARDLANVVVIHGRGAQLQYSALRDVRLVFIDGDHSESAVRADTQAALAHLSKVGGLIAWHDYYDEAPEWVGVKRVVDSLGLEIEHVDGTWLALARVPKGFKVA